MCWGEGGERRGEEGDRGENREEATRKKESFRNTHKHTSKGLSLFFLIWCVGNTQTLCLIISPSRQSPWKALTFNCAFFYFIMQSPPGLSSLQTHAYTVRLTVYITHFERSLRSPFYPSQKSPLSGHHWFIYDPIHMIMISDKISCLD